MALLRRLWSAVLTGRTWNAVADVIVTKTRGDGSAWARSGLITLFRAVTSACAHSVCWHRLESTTRASRCYAAATEADPRDFAALRALERLLEAMEDWAGAADLYESEIEVLGDEDRARTREAGQSIVKHSVARGREDSKTRGSRMGELMVDYE